jgi:RecA-family ATPase
MIQQIAKKLIDNGIFIIPLLPNEKYNGDRDILTKEYKVSDLIPKGNLGINLKKSNLYCVDLDTEDAIYFGNLWLPHNTRIHGRINNGVKQQTHFYFKSDGSIKENIKNRGVVDFLIDHNVVVFGQTKNKHSKLLMRRYIAKESHLCTFNESFLAAYNKVCFAAALAPHLKLLNANDTALKLDSCIMRYTNWNDEQREQFLLDVYQRVMPDSKDVKPKEFQRKIRSNNKKIKNAGYNALAKTIGVDEIQLKTWLDWIGKVPEDDKYQKVKSYRDFNSTGIDIAALMQTELPELRYAVKPILPEGLVLCAGRPKAMKSWTALKLAYAVQNGEKFLDHETIQGDVLGLFLEDNKRRLQDRINKLDYKDAKQHPTVDTEAPYLAFGLEESLQQWIDSRKNPRLIIIDTLAKVKPRTTKKNATAYDLDNEMLRELQKLAMDNNICILCISHLGKADRDYSWDKIQGSVGMQGITDAMWMIDRGDTSSNASVSGRGRDINDFAFAVSWSAYTWSYHMEGELDLIHAAENKKEIIKAMQELAKGGKDEVFPRDVINYYSFSHNSKDARRIQKTMQRMKEKFELGEGSKWGTYSLDKPLEPWDTPHKTGGIDFESDKGKGFENVKR